MEAISKNHTWMLVKLPQYHKPILVEWIFKIKEDQHKQTKYKAHLVAWDANKRPKYTTKICSLLWENGPPSN